MRRIPIASAVLLVSFAAGPGVASDGVLEINQTCAVETGCSAGDTPGFPVAITGRGGSYRLTSNLVVPDENTDAIELATGARDIRIDLGGFLITRSGCALSACTPTEGSGTGVRGDSSVNEGVSVRDGSIVGMGGWGVNLRDQAEVTGLLLRWNRLGGVSAGRGATVFANTIRENGGDGISASDGSTVSSNTVRSNGAIGISAGTGSTLRGNTVSENVGGGIVVTGGATIVENSAVANQGNGIEAGTGSNVLGNTSQGNFGRGIDARFGTRVVGNVVYNNGNGDATDDGIACEDGCTLTDNTARSNDGYGIRINGGGTSYRGNTLSNNSQGTVVGGTDVGGNLCNGSTTCP